MRTIALFPGSFNPVHNGHLGVARYVATNGLADEVWLVVSPQNPFKDAGELAPFRERLRMVELALEALGDERIKVCDIEKDLPRPSYTIDTLRALQSAHPDDRFILLVGSDVAAELPAWRESQEVRRMAQLLVYARDAGEASPELRAAPGFEIDSTWIRTHFAQGPQGAATIYEAKVLPIAVWDYICRKGLYGITSADDDPVETHYRLAVDHYRHQRFGPALSELEKTLSLVPDHTEALQLKELISSIFTFRYKDLYNP